MKSKKIDSKHAAHLNDPQRVKIQNPDLIWNKIASEDPQVLIDIGAGTGFFAVPFAKKMNTGKIYACDLSEHMLDLLKKNIPEGFKNIIVPVKTDENKVPLEDEIADLVFMANLHHELEDPQKMVAEAYRLLKNDGKLAIIDWKKDAPFGPPPSIRVTNDTIRAHMSSGGFSNIKEHNDLKFHYFLVGEKKARTERLNLFPA